MSMISNKVRKRYKVNTKRAVLKHTLKTSNNRKKYKKRAHKEETKVELEAVQYEKVLPKYTRVFNNARSSNKLMVSQNP